VNEETLAAFLALHEPDAQGVEGSMVYEIWEDGEVTLQKCGSLYGRRSMHTMWDAERGLAKTRVAIPVDRMPVKNWDGSHGCIQLKTSETVNKALDILFGKCYWTSRWYV
jgi:hypothetical protein